MNTTDLQTELTKLDYAYHVGSPEITLKNLGIDTSGMTSEQLEEEYIRVAKRIYEIQSLLNIDNCQ